MEMEKTSKQKIFCRKKQKKNKQTCGQRQHDSLTKVRNQLCGGGKKGQLEMERGETQGANQ